MTINLADAILKTAGLNEALMRECDIFFCDKPRDTEYSGARRSIFRIRLRHLQLTEAAANM